MDTHPTYNSRLLRKYRLTYTESEAFMSSYLFKRFNEVDSAWKDRQRLRYNPAFAREAVDEFARAMVQRSSEIQRIGGNPLYLEMCAGLNGGIDRQGSSLDSFLAQYVIGELMAMGSVGIYVDNDPFIPVVGETRPYIYAYKAEDILNWHYADGKLRALLLRNHVEELKDGLPVGIKEQYQKMELSNDGVTVTLYDDRQVETNMIVLPLKHIPFVHFRLPHSLLKDTADYQIALLNVTSAGTYLVWATNFPLYTEQSKPFNDINRNDDPENKERKVGTVTGVQYPTGTERPAWISPPTDPLEMTLKYSDALKMEIRQLTALAITNLAPKMASAESKAHDRLGLESGLSVIGMVLQSGENRLSEIWHEYKSQEKYTEVHYPEKYELLGEDDRRKSAREMKDLQSAVSSMSFQKETAKVIATILHSHRIPHDKLMQIHEEIDASPVPTADPDILRSDHEAGFVSDETASIGRGYKPGEATKAREDHAERLARIRIAQTTGLDNPGARGDNDADPDPGNSAAREKRISADPDLDDRGERRQRGKGK